MGFILLECFILIAHSIMEKPSSITFNCSHLNKNIVLVLTLLFLSGCGAVFFSSSNDNIERRLTTLRDFQAEKLFEVPTNTMGSWVGMTVDSKGRLITSSQFKGLHRITLSDEANSPEDQRVKVEPLRTRLRGAQGLLYAFESLYVLVGEKHKPYGLYRLTDTNGDDQFDDEELLQEFKSDGEHGLHSLVLSPDKQSVFIVGGNTSVLPKNINDNGPAKVWQEDLLLPRMWDARGHAKGRLAPGGFILSCDRNGRNFSLVASGFRNQFDAAFTASGELFTFDSDMEWDIGMPWYKPTRVLHVVSGADYGWRSGSGKWPNYYPDTLPPVIEMGLSSPTGLRNGIDAKFPAKYQKAIFLNDWTYGTMYAIHLVPDGASYRAEKEEFVSGVPLPLTDVIVRPQDGAMYFLVGGRKGQSALYKVSYIGQESTEPTIHPQMNAPAHQRVMLESLHKAGTPPSSITTAWPYLSHEDRFIRHAARVAIEKQPYALWAEKALSSKDNLTTIESMIALARVGGSSYQTAILNKLLDIDTTELNKQQLLGLLRAYQLAFIRADTAENEEGDATKQNVIAALDPLYPSMDNYLDRELSQVLLYLNAPGAVGKTVRLLVTAGSDYQYLQDESVLVRNQDYRKAADEQRKAAPNTQQIAMAFALRSIDTGWNYQDRVTYFSWFKTASTWSGGMSLAKFIQNMRKEALVTIGDPNLREEMAALSKGKVKPSRKSTPPKGPGRQWTVDEAMKEVENNLKERNFKQGENIFHATACSSCHRFAGQGGGIGPDITGAANRYTLRDMFEHIITPSKAISDQYGSENIKMLDGSQVIGRVGSQENGSLHIMTNPFAPESTIEVDVELIEERARWPVSSMPAGLVNGLNPNELSDLMAFIFSAGDPEHEYFEKNIGAYIFDGKSLTGWEGDKELWSVQDGAIVGDSHGKKLRNSSYLIWQGGEVADFHLSFETKLEGNNSGMQYRSELFADEPWRLKGYQADIHPKPEYTGMLYGEAIGRDIIATRGYQYIVDEASGKAQVLAKISKVEKLDLSQWHTIEIIAKGNHLVHKIDAQVVLDLTDNHREKRLEGLLGMQLHGGDSMKVWFRNIQLEHL